jgi:anti-sigma regulatory factor (Ser/Thr protein kinase)
MRSGTGELIRSTLPRAPECGAVARRLLTERAGDILAGQALEDAKLVATELANNAFLHGRGPIEFTVRLDGPTMRIEVVDQGSGASVRICDEATDDGGRGLLIVDRIAERWGAYEGTTHVWAEVATSLP